MGMMDYMKYIVIHEDWLETAIIFDSQINHYEMVQKVLGPMVQDPKVLKEKVLSAGFVILTPEGLQCFGRSVTMEINSRGEKDTDLINKRLGKEDD